MRLRKNHPPFFLLITAIAALTGLLAGYLAGSAVEIGMAEQNLQEYAASLMARSDAASGEARAVLSSMQASRYSYCSSDELDYFGLLVFRSRFLRDAGRMRAGRIDCSSVLGHLKEPVAMPGPDFEQMDGTKVYERIPLFQLDGLTAVTLQLGDAYVTLSPNLMLSLEVSPAHYVFSVVDPRHPTPGRLIGTPPRLSATDFTRDGFGRLGTTLYATRCSVRYFDCVTAYISVPEVMRIERNYRIGSSVTGALAGISICFLAFVLDQRRLGLARQFRRAIRKESLRVVYQPIVDLKRGRIVGAEALVRWTDEAGNTVSPEVFIPLAASIGLSRDVTRLVVRRSLRDFAAIMNRLPNFCLSVNVAADELLGPDLLPLLEQEATQARIAPRCLAVEITERSTASHDALVEAVRRLREKGFPIYIDDFGTGYSSLSYLRDLSVDAIKIDKSFTGTIGTQAVTASILPQIIEMAASLNLRLIVEGVETALQADYLASSPCSVAAQGWYFGYPVPAAEFHHLLHENEENFACAGVSAADCV